MILHILQEYDSVEYDFEVLCHIVRVGPTNIPQEYDSAGFDSVECDSEVLCHFKRIFDILLLSIA